MVVDGDTRSGRNWPYYHGQRFRKWCFVDLEPVDLAIAMLVLHHIANIDVALQEVARALKTNGRLFIVDMVAHDRRAYAASMGHVHLGFSADTIRRLAKVAGFELRRYRLLASDPVATGPGVFTALLVRKPH